MAAVAVGRCTSQFVGTPICYVNRGLHAQSPQTSHAGEFSGLDWAGMRVGKRSIFRNLFAISFSIFRVPFF
jgi:hypothetical protein